MEFLPEDDRTGMSPETLRRAVTDHLRFTLAKDLLSATPRDVYEAMVHATRDRIVHRWMSTQRRYAALDVKRVYYLSAEYLPGRWLESHLLSLGVLDYARRGLTRYRVELADVFEQEPDPGLGNGGLGRLAACLMDSLATLQYPAMGYGLRYEFGIFQQEIQDGWQVEHPDDWLRLGNPWEIRRPEYMVTVPFGGHVSHETDRDGKFRARWHEGHNILGVPFDLPVPGYGNNTVHTLRLWSAHASQQFDLAVFNDGDYRRAVERKALDEALSKVLYPKDTSREGKLLRLKQQYFFVCCSIADLVRRYQRTHETFAAFPDKVAIQLNDTHPAIAVAELMRVLVDTHELPWEEAWDITQRSCGYTNHTLLPEALEIWPLEMFSELLPRHLEIIREIDRRFQRLVHVVSKGDQEKGHRMAIVDEAGRNIRMAHLAVVGSHKINGVAALHGQLLREHVLHDFAELWPERFTHVTNGVTPRRWLLQCNPELAQLLRKRVGSGFETDMDKLRKLLEFQDDPQLHNELQLNKRNNKQRLASALAQWTGKPPLEPHALFDVQIKRIHEYKRQLMCALHAVWLFYRMRFRGEQPIPRAVLIGGKAAPGYVRAKQHIKVISDISATLEADPGCQNRLRLVFVPNYGVSRAERIVPAADLSEQISTAGKEASGTGNMKFMMNGAITIGTLDGANVEILEEVGDEAFFRFGLDAAAVDATWRSGWNPSEAIARSERLQAVLGLLEEGFFATDAREVHREVAQYLRHEDPFLVCADFDAYCEAQERVEAAFTDPARWGRMMVRNIACSGRFSSDRTIRAYAQEIWGLEATPVDLVELTLS